MASTPFEACATGNRGEHHRVPGPFSGNRSRSRLNRVLGSGNRSRSRFNRFPVSRTRYRNRLGTGFQPGTRFIVGLYKLYRVSLAKLGLYSPKLSQLKTHILQTDTSPLASPIN